MIPIFPFVGYSQENINLTQRRRKSYRMFQFKTDKINAKKIFSWSESKWNEFTLQGENKVSLEKGASLSTSSANLFSLSSGSYTI